jgi:hypothetical protein
MSNDRREAVAKAIDTELRRFPVSDVESYEWDGMIERISDAAIAAMTAAPTDAEVEAAIDQVIRCAFNFGRAERVLQASGLGGEMGYEDARADLTDAKRDLIALIAARKAGQP